jgi:hypothetical protein
LIAQEVWSTAIEIASLQGLVPYLEFVHHKIVILMDPHVLKLETFAQQVLYLDHAMLENVLMIPPFL